MQSESRPEAKTLPDYSGFPDRRKATDKSEDETPSFQEYWRILKRRRYLFILPALGVVLAVAIFAASIPATYRSVAKILIEDQEIPEDIVGATMSNYASQQIQLVSQRLFTATNIKQLVDKFSIYKSKNPDRPISTPALVEQFRKDMDLQVVSADVLSPRGQSMETAVAFTLAFKSHDPELSQRVTQELVTLFLNENKRSSSSRTAGVSELLQTAVDKANTELTKAEADLAAFKVENEGALPESQQANRDVINRSQQQLSDVQLRLGDLQQRKLQLSVQLSSLSPSAPVTLPSGETVMGDRERLKALLLEYRRKSATYQPGHPDLVKLEREIETLKKTVGGSETYSLLQDQLRQERDRLKALKERYSEDYPDVKSAEATIAELESQLAATDSRDSAKDETPDNPAYILVNTQLQSVKLEIDSLTQRRKGLEATIEEHEALLKKAPHVEAKYEALRRTYENARTKHNELAERLRAADVASDVEQEITGQRFSVVEPPELPINPEPRNRAAIGVLGIILAIGIGAACVVFAEFMDNTIHNVKMLTKIAGTPPLAVIPYLDNNADIAHANRQRLLVGAALVGITAICVGYVIISL